MIERIIRWCATNRAVVLIVVAVLVAIGVWSIQHIAIDALPDLSDTQVIVMSKWDRSPDIVEDQVTYPIITALLGAPHVKAIRGFSDFGYSYVYVVFEDGTDIYWARSRVLEYLQQLGGRLPAGVAPELGPDATGAGWVAGTARPRRLSRPGRRDRQAARAAHRGRPGRNPLSAARGVRRCRRPRRLVHR